MRPSHFISHRRDANGAAAHLPAVNMSVKGLLAGGRAPLSSAQRAPRAGVSACACACVGYGALAAEAKCLNVAGASRLLTYLLITSDSLLLLLFFRKA